jgi:hypothetical protein
VPPAKHPSQVPSGVASARPAPPRDFDGVFKALLHAHPRDTLELLCGATVRDGDVVSAEPTEQPRQRNRQCDNVFSIQHHDGTPTDVYQVEIQLKRTEDFQERMVSYWASLATRYQRATHRIHQVVLWPEGGGYPGRFERDQERLDYHAVNLPDDFDPDTLLASPNPALALFTRKPPHDLVERVTDRIVATEKHHDKLLQTELGMLARGSVATQLVEALRRRGMNNILEQTETGREIARKNREQGREEGREEGREQGREEGHVDLMRAALQAAYGDITDLDELARRLADRDHSGSISRIIAGAPLDDLRA